jgi:stringent starvation protein B
MNNFKPYMLDAYLRWFGDNNVTPMLGVAITPQCNLPQQFMDQKELWLNVHPQSTRDFGMNEHGVFFQTRFNQVAHSVFLPWESLQVVRAREWPFVLRLDDLIAPSMDDVNAMKTQQPLSLMGRDSLSPERPAPIKPKLTLIQGGESETTDGPDLTPPPTSTPRSHLRRVK